LIPDLAVEIVSKNDSYSDVQDKVETYQADGVRLIWVIDPIRRKVDVYEGSQRATLSESDSLTGGGVIPGFAMLVSRLFD
jgi:Uma2 family endonuclease